MPQVAGYNLKFQVIPEENADAFIMDPKTGGERGYVRAGWVPELDAYSVLIAKTDETVPKGKGIGRQIYTALDAEIKRKTGKPLASDAVSRQEPGSRGMWDALVKTGKAKGPIPMPNEPNDKYYVMEDSGNYSQGKRMPASMKDIYPTDADKRTQKKMGEDKKKRKGKDDPTWVDELRGGRADGDVPGDFSADQLEKGIKHEMEHTDSKHIAKEIAMDHLVEDPEYYDHLKESRTPKMIKVFESVLKEMSGALRDQFEDAYPEGLCPKKWAEKLLRTHKLEWKDFASETGAPPQMPDQVEWSSLMDWMGY